MNELKVLSSAIISIKKVVQLNRISYTSENFRVVSHFRELKLSIFIIVKFDSI